MKSFLKQTGLLLEADTDASTLFEQVICDCWNIISKNPKMTEEEWLGYSNKKEMAFLKKFVKKYGGKKFGIPAVKKAYKPALLHLHGFAKLLHQKAGKLKGSADQVGKEKGTVSPWWNEMTAKAVDTWKTDIQIGSARISVKNGKGARIMSGVTEESVATLNAAAKAAGLDEVLRKKIDKLMNQFVELKLWTQSGGEDNLLASPNTTAGEKVLKIEKKKRDKWLEDRNKEAIEILEEGYKLKPKVVAAVEEAFSSNAKFQIWFAYEAATGWEKFGGKLDKLKVSEPKGSGEDAARADYMLAFSEDIQKLRIEPMNSIKSSVVKHISSQMSIAPDFKSNRFGPSKGKKLGQKIYQSFQMKMTTIFDEGDKYQTEANEEIDKWENMLTEGLISELALWDKIKSIASKMVNFFKEMWSRAKKVMLEFVDKIKQALNDGLQGILAAFDFDISAVKHKTEVNLL